MSKVAEAEVVEKKLAPHKREASFAPATMNDEDRTVEVIFATDFAAPMWDWDLDDYLEVLSFEAGSVRMARLNAGAPVLVGHNRQDQIGVVISATLDAAGKLGKAVLKFSKNARASEYWQDIKDGIVKNISVGYWVYAYQLTKREAGELPEYTAIDWEPYEISVLSVPADYKAGIRSARDEKNEINVKINNTMTKPAKTVEPVVEPTGEEGKERGAGAGKKPAKTTDTDPANEDPDGSKAREAGIQKERKRVVAINDAVRAAGLDESFATKLINDGVTISRARAMVIEKAFKKDEQQRGGKAPQHNGTGVTGKDEQDKKREAWEESILCRVDTKQKREKSKDLAGYKFVDLARHILEDAGISTIGWSYREIAEMAINKNKQREAFGGMSIGDFPAVLGNVFHKRLLDEYALYPRTFQSWCRQSTAVDFRQNLRIRLSDIGAFPEVKENDEYTAVTLTDNQETYVVKKYGKIVPISWEAIINDDLNAFSRIPASIAMAAAQTQSNIVYNLLFANNNMNQDGNPVFGTAHANYVASGSGSAPSINSLTAARAAMRIQKTLAGNYMNLTPRILLVSPELEVVANQLTSFNYYPTQTSNINPEFFKALMPIIEPRLMSQNAGLGWYMFADPATIDTFEYAFLEGEGELFTEQKWNFGTDRFELKARMVFGAQAIDYRGGYFNYGS